MNKGLSKLENETAAIVKRNVYLAAEDEALLGVVLGNSVHYSVAAKAKARVKRSPKAIEERVAEVSFKPRQWSLSEDLVSVIRSVVGKKLGIRIRVDLPFMLRTERM